MVAVMFVWMVLLCVVLGTRGADGGSQERPAALYNNCTLLERDVSCCGEGSCAVAMGGAWPLAGLLLLRDSVGSELSVWLDGRLVAKVPPGEPWAPLPPLPAGRLEVGAEPPGCFRVSLFGCAGRDHSIGVGGTRSTGHAAVKRSAASATRQVGQRLVVGVVTFFGLLVLISSSVLFLGCCHARAERHRNRSKFSLELGRVDLRKDTVSLAFSDADTLDSPTFSTFQVHSIYSQDVDAKSRELSQVIDGRWSQDIDAKSGELAFGYPDDTKSGLGSQDIDAKSGLGSQDIDAKSGLGSQDIDAKLAVDSVNSQDVPVEKKCDSVPDTEPSPAVERKSNQELLQEVPIPLQPHTPEHTSPQDVLALPQLSPQHTPSPQHTHMPPSSQHTHMPPSPQHTHMPPSPQHTHMPPSPQHTHMPPSPQHTQMPPSPQHTHMPPSPQHTQIPPSPQHTQMPPSPQHTQMPPSPQHMLASPHQSPKHVHMSASPQHLTHLATPRTSILVDSPQHTTAAEPQSPMHTLLVSPHASPKHPPSDSPQRVCSSAAMAIPAASLSASLDSLQLHLGLSQSPHYVTAIQVVPGTVCAGRQVPKQSPDDEGTSLDFLGRREKHSGGTVLYRFDPPSCPMTSELNSPSQICCLEEETEDPSYLLIIPHGEEKDTQHQPPPIPPRSTSTRPVTDGDPPYESIRGSQRPHPPLPPLPLRSESSHEYSSINSLSDTPGSVHRRRLMFKLGPSSSGDYATISSPQDDPPPPPPPPHKTAVKPRPFSRPVPPIPIEAPVAPQKREPVDSSASSLYESLPSSPESVHSHDSGLEGNEDAFSNGGAPCDYEVPVPYLLMKQLNIGKVTRQDAIDDSDCQHTAELEEENTEPPSVVVTTES